MCLSHLIYTVRPCLIHICHAAPIPCSDHAVLLKIKWERHILDPYRQGMAGERHGRDMLCVNRPLRSQPTGCQPKRPTGILKPSFIFLMNTGQSAGSAPFRALIGGRGEGGGYENEQDESNVSDRAGPICHQS
jgi:hypothetical protein